MRCRAQPTYDPEANTGAFAGLVGLPSSTPNHASSKFDRVSALFMELPGHLEPLAGVEPESLEDLALRGILY